MEQDDEAQKLKHEIDPIANSSRFVLPRGTAPAVMRRSTTVAFMAGSKWERACEPQVFAQPSSHKLSLIKNGAPSKSPSGFSMKKLMKLLLT